MKKKSGKPTLPEEMSKRVMAADALDTIARVADSAFRVRSADPV